MRQLATVKDGDEVAAEMRQLVEHLTEKLVERDATREFRMLRPLAEGVRRLHVDGTVCLDDRESSTYRADDIVAKLKGGRGGECRVTSIIAGHCNERAFGPP